MPLKVTGRHMHVDEETRQYLDKKVNRLRRIVSEIDEMSFTFSAEKLRVLVEGSFRAGRVAARARVRAARVHEAIDALVDKLEAQVTKAKKKQADKSLATREHARLDEMNLELNAEAAE